MKFSTNCSLRTPENNPSGVAGAPGFHPERKKSLWRFENQGLCGNAYFASFLENRVFAEMSILQVYIFQKNQTEMLILQVATFQGRLQV